MGIKVTFDNVSIDGEELKRIVKEAVKEALHEQSEMLHNPNNEELLTQKQAAELLQVTTATIIRWQRIGELPVTRVGRSVRYRKSDLLGLKDKKK